MPGMDGFEAAAAIKKMPALPRHSDHFRHRRVQGRPPRQARLRGRRHRLFRQAFRPGHPADEDRHLFVLPAQEPTCSSERERHIRESEELIRVGRKLSSVLESLPVGVMIADVEGRICQITEEVSRILRIGRAGGQRRLRQDPRLVGCQRQDPEGRAGPALARASHGASAPIAKPIRIQCLDGSVKTIVASASPLRAARRRHRRRGGAAAGHYREQEDRGGAGRTRHQAGRARRAAGGARGPLISAGAWA